MTKTLKELQEEHPELCWECGFYSKDLCEIYGCSDTVPTFKALITTKREDEVALRRFERDARAFLGRAIMAESQLTAEQQAHAETRKQLDSMTVAMRAIVRMAGVEDADLRRIIRETAQASINRPTDNSPTDDRGEGEK